MTKKVPNIELRFLNSPNSLASMNEFETVCQRLRRLVIKLNKEAAAIADECGVVLGTEIYFDLTSKEGASDGSSES